MSEGVGRSDFLRSVSWHVAQFPGSETTPSATKPPADKSSFIPAAPVIDGLRIENGPTPRERCSRIRFGQRRPGVKRIEHRGSRLVVTRRYEPTRHFEQRKQKVNARVDADRIVYSRWPSVCGDGDRNANQTALPQQPIRSGLSGKRGDVDTVVAVGTVNSPKNRVLALRLQETLLHIGGGNGHAIARLVACTTVAAIGAQALQERSRQVDASARCAICLGRAAPIREKHPVGDEGSGGSLLSTCRGNKSISEGTARKKTLMM